VTTKTALPREGNAAPASIMDIDVLMLISSEIKDYLETMHDPTGRRITTAMLLITIGKIGYGMDTSQPLVNLLLFGYGDGIWICRFPATQGSVE